MWCKLCVPQGPVLLPSFPSRSPAISTKTPLILVDICGVCFIRYFILGHFPCPPRNFEHSGWCQAYIGPQRALGNWWRFRKLPSFRFPYRKEHAVVSLSRFFLRSFRKLICITGTQLVSSIFFSSTVSWLITISQHILFCYYPILLYAY